MEFRWYIGKTIDGSANLIDFDPVLWTDLSGGNWTLNMNFFRHTIGLIDGIETQLDIFTEGEEYYITYNVVDNSGGSAVGFVRPYAGDFSVSRYEANNTVGYGLKVIDKYFVRAGTKLRFVVGDDLTLSDLIVYPYVWGMPLEDEDTPYIDSENVYEIKRSERILTSAINSIQGCKFYGASYDAIRNQIALGFRFIPVKIECRQSRFDAWETYFLGNIYVNDIQWNLKDNTCSVDIEDNGGGNLILKNLDKPVTISNHFGWHYDATTTEYFTQQFTSIAVHDPDIVAFHSQYLGHIRVDRLLECVLYEATDLRVGLTTSSLENQEKYLAGGNPDIFCAVGTKKITAAPTITVAQNRTLTVTLREVLENYYKLFNCFSYCSTAGYISSLVCDNMLTLRSIGGLNFVGVYDIKLTINPSDVKTIKIGFDKKDTNDNSGVLDFNNNSEDYESIEDLSCLWHGGNTNNQNTAFYGAGANKLNSIIWTMEVDGTAGTPDKYDDDKFIVEYEYDIGAGGYVTVVGTNRIYNETFRPDTWLNIHAVTINSTLNSSQDERFNIYTLTNYFTVTGLDTYLYNTEFEYPMTFADFKTIITNPYAVILIDSDEIHPFTGAKVNSFFQPTEIRFYPNKNKATFKGFMV